MTVVIKVGGARAVDPAGALADVASLVDSGEDTVVTHGGSTAVDDTLERLGMEPEYVETPSGVVGRFTDEDTIEVFEMVMPGLLNTEMVAGLQSEDVDAVGLSGVDGKLLYGPRKSAVRVVEDGKRKIRRGDHSGSIKQVNGDLLESLLSDGYTPVVSPPMAGADEDGVTPVNTDADRSAAAIAGELDGTLVLLTDVPGILEDPDDRDTLIREVETPEDWTRMEDAAEGFMGRKVMAIREALEGGAPEVIVADANIDQPVATAMEGDGTHVYPSALPDDAETDGGDDE
ncbi:MULTISPECIES: acetylglutamate/acetylaminoadipate kinase [Salinibaculum]|uniref:acetylglutamate/acetylaminoadipate kinase n=1 Tax=Salinibaculum TaxID=2732368 RepID=UPI0030D5E7EB